MEKNQPRICRRYKIIQQPEQIKRISDKNRKERPRRMANPHRNNCGKTEHKQMRPLHTTIEVQQNGTPTMCDEIDDEIIMSTNNIQPTKY